jgi:hypothetical protein
MIRIYIFLFTAFLVTAPFQSTKAQLQELEELALDIQKLASLKNILNDMYKGYEILTKGYNTIKDISEGNFSLHKLFLDGLLTVSPTVKKYERIVEIIQAQKDLVTQYKSALNRFSGLQIFNNSEINYLQSVYSNLFDRSLNNLDELLMVITDSKLRMNDAERLHAIDRIYDDMEDKLEFLNSFNNNTSILAEQRKKDLSENNYLKSIYGLPLK